MDAEGLEDGSAVEDASGAEDAEVEAEVEARAKRCLSLWATMDWTSARVTPRARSLCHASCRRGKDRLTWAVGEIWGGGGGWLTRSATLA